VSLCIVISFVVCLPVVCLLALPVYATAFGQLQIKECCTECRIAGW